MTDVEPAIRGYKHSLNQLFHRRDAERIDRAVQHVHAVMCEATLLIKYRLLKASRTTLRDQAPMVIDECLVLTAVRAVVGHREDTDDVPTKCRKVSSDPLDRGVAVRQQVVDSWATDYREMYSGDSTHAELVDSTLSVSQMFAIAAKQYVAAVLTNIRYHFRQYVCASLGLVLRSAICTIEGVTSFNQLTPVAKRRWRREMGKAYDDVLFRRSGRAMKSDARLHHVIERHRPRLVPTMPPRKTIDQDLDGAHRPFVYLGYMVRMVAFLEATGSKDLLSPLPLKTSFVPAHYSIDTSGITQLLFDGTVRIKRFAHFFEHSVQGGFPLPLLKTKATLGSSLATLSERASVTPDEEELYKDALWTFLCNFKNRRTKVLNPLLHGRARRPGAMRFDHSISTDGYNVTMVVTDRATRGRKHVFKSAVSRRATKVAKSSEFPVMSPEKVDEVMDLLGSLPKPPHFVGGDPGKTVNLQLVDKEGKKLRYTTAQRQNDTLSVERTGRVSRARNRIVVEGSPTASSRECDMRRAGLTSRTCNVGRFKLYITFRETSRQVFVATYTKRTFRAMRFLAWSRRAASVAGFVKRILEKYGVQNRTVVIFYGDWGRQPNLKHQAPSPGIGLQRLIHATVGIVTLTVHEAYTSSFCARRGCHGAVENARGAHGLLQCTACGTRWSRDILGAKNILDTGLHIMEHRAPHPVFG